MREGMGESRHLEFLGPVDAAFWYLDTRKTPMNIGSIMIFDGLLDYEQVLAVLDSRLHKLPLYQQKVVQPQNNLGEPRWVFDEDFYIENHVFKRTMKPKSTEADLRELASQVIGRKLDRNKPLWELHVINGFEDQKSALLFKVHHCMVDGISAIELFTLVLDISPEQPIIEAKPVYDPPPTPGERQMLEATLLRAAGHRLSLMRRMGTTLFNLGVNALDRDQRKKTLVGIVSLINDNLTAIKPLAINGENSGELTVAWSEFSMLDVLEIRQQRRVSVNDVMLAILGAAIGRYQQTTGEEVKQDFVRIIIPVNMRNESLQENVGNRISMLPIEIPLFAGDMLDCLDAVAAYTSVLKESELAKAFDVALTMPALAVPALQPFIWDIVPKIFVAIAHTWATNVAGPSTPMFFMGHELQHVYGFLPINPSMGLASTILSYDGRISLNMLADKAIIQDVNLLKRFVDECYAELCEACQISHEDTVEIEEVLEPELQQHEEPIFSDFPDSPLQTATIIAEAQAAVKAEPTIRLMSEEWALALQEAVNNSRDYHRASTHWTAGQVAMIMQPAPEKGFHKAEAVLLDLYRGKCREAHNVPLAEAKTQANFVLEGSYNHWMDILERRAQVIPMLLRGRLKLAKGHMRQLIPFTKSSRELVNCAIEVTQSQT
jgi:diacylglycerol O-acyltransferase